MNDSLFEWAPATQEKGVIVGCTEALAWILPWWWMHFRMHNECPVTFFDFGDLSTVTKEWCLKRGEIRKLPTLQIVSQVKPNEQKPDLTPQVRQAWFQIPFACLNSPYEKSLWIDLDCQVRYSVEQIFGYCKNPLGLSLVLENPTLYNGGVLVFKHGSPLIQEWAKECLAQSASVRGTQNVLTDLIFKKNVSIPPIPQQYNRLIQLQENQFTLQGEGSLQEASILHWVGQGKMFIKAEIDFLEKNIFMNFALEHV